MAMGTNKGPFSEINVTTLVDVMLVILIIFMIAAPLMFNGIQLDLPKTREVNPITMNSQQVILSFSKTKEYYVGKDKVLENELVARIQSEMQTAKSEVVFLRADFSLDYGSVAALMSFLKSNGINKIALV